VSNESKRHVRIVLDYLADIKDALDDTLTAMALEDTAKARAHLSSIENGAAHAIKALSHEEE
jgi:hypothetical protein